MARCEVLAKGVVYNLHRSFCVVVDVWCVWWALRGGSAVGLGIIATEQKGNEKVLRSSRVIW
jgi:hypothetical protein